MDKKHNIYIRIKIHSCIGGKKMDKMLKYGGIVLMVVGVWLILSGVPALPMALVSLGPLSADLPQAIASRIMIGAVVTFLGYKSYSKGK